MTGTTTADRTVVLALESATDVAGVALADATGTLASVSSGVRRRHAETIVPAVDFVCRMANVELASIRAVAVDVGPGLFTGLRVGVASAKAFAFALGVPVVTATSLELLARAAADAVMVQEATVVSVVDARRGELFVQFFRPGPDGVEPVGDATRQTPEGLAAALRAVGEPAVVVGDGACRYEPVLRGIPGTTVAGAVLAHPPVAGLAALGVARADKGDVRDSASVVPWYLRDADTRINWERRARRPAPGEVTPEAVV